MIPSPHTTTIIRHLYIVGHSTKMMDTGSPSSGLKKEQMVYRAATGRLAGIIDNRKAFQ